MDEQKKPRAWIYARIPGDYDGTMNSYKVCSMQALHDGCDIVGGSIDERGGWLLRPGYRDMMQQIKGGKIISNCRCLQKCFPAVAALRDGLQLLFGKRTDIFVFCHLLLLIVHKVPVLIVSNSLTPAIDNQPNDNHIHLHRKPVFRSCCGSQ